MAKYFIYFRLLAEIDAEEATLYRPSASWLFSLFIFIL